MQGAGTMQQTSQSGVGVPELRDVLTNIEELARRLGAGNREQIEALAKETRVEADRSQPSQGRMCAPLVSMKTVAETFAGGTAANLATSTIDPAKAPAIVELVQRLLSR
jgi:hypothetical protein